jgi:hypothetical protein
MKGNRIVLLAVLAVVASTTAFAQMPIGKAQIPFAFSVGKYVMPAGEYRIDIPTLGSPVLRMRGPQVLVFLTNHTQANTRPEQGKLVFHRYGNHYFLEEVWTAGDTDGRQIPRTSLERELAQNQQAKYVVLALLQKPSLPSR